MALSASFTFCPAKSLTSSVNRHWASIGQTTGPVSLLITPFARQTR